MRLAIAASGCCILLAACDQTRAPASAARPAAQFKSSAAADSILSFGEAVYKQSQYDSATTILSHGRDVAVAAGDSSAVARADTWLGLTAWKQGKHARARTLGEGALAMKLRLGLKRDLFRSYNALGLLAWTEGRYADAETLYGKAKQSAEAVNDSVSIAKAIANLGLVHDELGEFGRARGEFQVLNVTAHSAHDTVAEGNSLANLGMVEVHDGNPSAAIDWLQRARALYSAVNSPGGQDAVLGQMGSAYASMGELQKAIVYMDSAVADARAHGLVREQAEDLQIYAELMGEAGDQQAAIRHLARARKLADSAGLASRAGDIALAQARAEAAVSRTDLAIAKAREAVAIHRTSGARLEELKDRLLLAEIAQGGGQADQAQAELRAANEISRGLALPIAAEHVALGTARVADLAGDASSVLRALPGNLTFSRMGLQAGAEAEALRARAFARLKQWPEAAAEGKRAIASLETIRAGLGEGPLRAAFTSDRALVYADLVLALLQLGRTDEAFEVADAARGRALLEHLSVMRGNVRATAGDLFEADRLLRRIDYLTEKLRVADTVKSPERTISMRKDLLDLSARLTAARKDYEDRMRTVARTDPRGSALLGVAKVGFREIQQALEPSEVLVEYLAAENQLLIFVATRDTVVESSSNVSLEDLANRVRLASDILRRSTNAGDGRKVLRTLYDVVIGPVEKTKLAKEGATLIVIPHSALAYLPFAALVAPDGRRLVEAHPILELPSAGALPVLRGDSREPVAGASAVLAPFPEELAGTAAEAAVVKRATTNAATYLGARATEAQLRQALAVSPIVHVASHAVLDQTNAMFSHIELAAAPKRSPEDDGSLEVHELLGIPVRSRLVYLSGCETGVGAAWSTSFSRSQDYATLSQAMLFAGAQNVVATLWRIDDIGASVFARRFYAALPANDVTGALAMAQRAMIRDPRYSTPRFWAGYTVSGAGRVNRGAQTGKRVSVQ